MATVLINLLFIIETSKKFLRERHESSLQSQDYQSSSNGPPPPPDDHNNYQQLSEQLTNQLRSGVVVDNAPFSHPHPHFHHHSTVDQSSSAHARLHLPPPHDDDANPSSVNQFILDQSGHPPHAPSSSNNNNNQQHPPPANTQYHQPSVRLEILSSADSLKVSIDGILVKEDSLVGSGRGIHVLVLNQVTGAVMASRLFDTYSPNEDDVMSLFLQMVSDGRILVFGIKDEGSFMLKSRARALLTSLGSRKASLIGWRDTWAFVTRKGAGGASRGGGQGSSWSSSSLMNADGGDAPHHDHDAPPTSNNLNHVMMSGDPMGEVHSKSPSFDSWAQPVFLKLNLPLVPPDQLTKCDWDMSIESSSSHESPSPSSSAAEEEQKKDQNRRRTEFCSLVEGYGSVCSCEDPAIISFPFQPLDGPLVIQSSSSSSSSNSLPSSGSGAIEPKVVDISSTVPISIIASNRPHYLYT